MARRARKSIVALHRQIAKDNAKTIKANSPGGRYYRPTVTDKVRKVGVQKP
jgi:hypothetical protein